MVFEVDLQGLGNYAFDLRPHFGISESSLGLALELGLRKFHADDGGKALTGVLTRKIRLVVLDELLLSAVVVDYPGDRASEAGYVASTVYGVYAVGKGLHQLREAVVVLKRGLDDGPVYLLLYVDRIDVHDAPILIQASHEAGDATLKVVCDLVVGPQVHVAGPVAAELDPQSLVEVSHLLKALRQYCEVIHYVVEYLGVGNKGYRCSGLFRMLSVYGLDGQVGRALALGKLLAMYLVVSIDFNDQTRR